MIYDLASSAADYPERIGPPHRSILICTYQRSGSTLLGEAMHSTGVLGCPLEYFHRGFASFGERWGARDAFALADRLHRHRTDPGGTLSVKLMWPDLARIADSHDAALAAGLRLTPAETSDESYRRVHVLLADILPNPAWIWLRRVDTLRQAVSLYRARKSGIWRGLEWAAGRDTSDPDYDFEALLRTLSTVRNAQEHWRRFFAAAGIEARAVTYEALSTNYEGTLRQLFAEMGARDAQIPAPRLQRQADRRSEALANKFLREIKDGTTRSENR
jgi:LPS sulfotransferase NodH